MKIVGVMSGTSADGLDIALCDVADTEGGLQAQIIVAETITYDAELRQRILLACDIQHSNTQHISTLHTDLGIFIGEQVCHFLQSYNQFADLVASHGQTIWHEVNNDGIVQSTLQIGSSAHIAELTGITTIHDFRSRDVAAGGQGAPLTAYIDSLLLRHPTKTRAIQNIGGIGNVTVLPNHSDAIIAFDTGAGNVLIDSAMTIITDGEQSYDRDGQLAAQGTVNENWLEDLMQHPYYHRLPPKTTGRELFTSDYVHDLLMTARERGLSDADIIATLTALTARSIAHAYQTHVTYLIDEVIIGGGGARNLTLMRFLKSYLPDCEIVTHEDIGIDSGYKEGLVFAVLGWLTWHNRVGTSPMQTGAHHASVLGTITPAKNYVSLLQNLVRHLDLC
ncbi:MAG: anhydro-N-acetylmuramic acid kinase [Chloroflexota bacterium]